MNDLHLDADQTDPCTSTATSSSTDTPLPTDGSNPLYGKVKGSKKKVARSDQVVQDGTRGKVTVVHVDLIKDTFWKERPWLLL